MFIFQVKYFLLILNPEIKFIILRKRLNSKSLLKNDEVRYWERIFNIISLKNKIGS